MPPRIFPLGAPPVELQVLGVNPYTPPPVRNAPLYVKRNPAPPGIRRTSPRMGGLRLYPSDADAVFNPDGTPPSGSSQSALAAGGSSSPIGNSGVDWYNPITNSSVPIIGAQIFFNGVVPITPILQGNLKRATLIIQNSSSATSPDTAPIFYVDFNHQPSVLGSLALPPGFGFFWGASDGAPRDAIYILAGQFLDTGSTTIVSGVVIQGTYSPVAMT